MENILFFTSFIASISSVAFFSSVETALSGVGEARVRMANQQKLYNAKHLHTWLTAPGRILTTLYLLRLIFVISAGAAAIIWAQIWPYPWVHACVAITTALILLFFGHLLPRTLAKKYSMFWALSTIRPTIILCWFLFPLVGPLWWIAQTCSRRLSPTTETKQSPHHAAFWTPDEMGKLVEDAQVNVLSATSGDLFKSMIEFSDTVIREIMIPRTEMITLPVSLPPLEVRRIVVEAGHSRIPIYEDTIDNILGLLYVKDLSGISWVNSNESEPIKFDLKTYVRPTFYVPEVMKISELLREFQRRKTHMAIVVDEYGGTAGLVTLEDIIEEIVGEIQDEFDVEEKQFRLIGENKIIADGRVRIWDLEEPLHIKFPDGAYETLAGFLTSRTGYLPPQGSVISWNNLIFTVKEASEKRIGTVEIERHKVET